MGYYATDTNLSLETRGAVAAVLAHGQTTFTVQNIRDVGASKATAYRILGELRANGYVQKGGGHTYQWLKSYRLSGNPEIRKTGKHAHLLDHDLNTSSEMCEVSDFPENEHVFNHSSDDGPEWSGETRAQQAAPEITQPPLLALSEPPPPVSAPPPAPEKTRKPAAPRKPKATPEQAAIRTALRQAANWGPDAKANKQAADNGDLLMAFDPGATPERIATFARRWFPRYSPVANAAARRQDTASNPTPGQVVQYWPGFQAWEQEQAKHVAREAARRDEPADSPVVLTQAEREANRRILDEARRRMFSAGSGSAPPRALVASGRAT